MVDIEESSNVDFLWEMKPGASSNKHSTERCNLLPKAWNCYLYVHGICL